MHSWKLLRQYAQVHIFLIQINNLSLSNCFPFPFPLQESEEAEQKIRHLLNTACPPVIRPPPTTAPPPTSTTAETYQSNNESPLNGTVDYVEILSCAIDVSRNFTEEFNLSEIWEIFEPQLASHLANITECPSLGDADAVQACYNAELQATNTTFRAFLSLVEEVAFG